jgi:drug/metabolite transporter (DMT)-like permease
MLVVSWVAAVVACVGYGVASVLQSVGAKRTAAATGLGGVAAIMVQGPYLLGLGADVVAFLANVVALQRLPLFLVQAILTASVGVTAVVAALRGTRLSWKDWVSLAVLGAGLVLLSVSASSESALQVSSRAQWLILSASMVSAAVGLVGYRLRGRASSLVMAFAAGLGFSGVAVAARGLSGRDPGWSTLTEPLLWTIVAQGAVALIFFALALQRGSVTPVTAITFMTELVVPSLVGLLLFGDTVHPGYLPVAVLGFVLALAGTVSLMRYAE